MRYLHGQHQRVLTVRLVMIATGRVPKLARNDATIVRLGKNMLYMVMSGWSARPLGTLGSAGVACHPCQMWYLSLSNAATGAQVRPV